MMQRKKFILSLIILATSTLLVSSSFAASCPKTIGIVSYNKIELECLDVMGRAALSNTTVKGTTQIEGTLNANQSHLNQLNGKGKLEFNQTMVDGLVNVFGLLEAKQSTFKNDITITADKADFKNSATKNIFINADEKTSELFLTNTIVNGDINFVGKEGMVYLYGSSKVTGKVKGARVQMK